MTELEIYPSGSARPALVGRKLLCLEETDSTNTYLKRLSASGSADDGTVVIASRQTAGRGRRGRSFESPEGLGLYLSVLLRPMLSPERLLPVTALTGTAVCNAIEAVSDFRPNLKWPNDLLLNGKKICGILAETVPIAGEPPALIIGIGVNVLHRPEDFSPAVREIASSLFHELGQPISQPALAAAEIAALDEMYHVLLSGKLGAWLETYRRDCITLGREVQILHNNGEREQVTALDIDEQFGLIVRRPDGTRTVVRSGEVSIR